MSTVLINISGEILLVPFILRVQYSRTYCASEVGKIFHAILGSHSAAFIIQRTIQALFKPGINCLQALHSNHTVSTTHPQTPHLTTIPSSANSSPSPRLPPPLPPNSSKNEPNGPSSVLHIPHKAPRKALPQHRLAGLGT